MSKMHILGLVLACLIPLSGCYSPGGPVPENPKPPAARQPIPQKVIVEEQTIYSPAPRDNGMPPESCDYIHFIRYRPATPDGKPKEVNAILVLMPGYMGGANEFEYMGRQLVSMSEAQGKESLEVWAIDRRPNCLEDLTGMNAAEESGELPDPKIAIDYYYRGSTIKDKRFQGFLKEQDVPYLSEFGLKLAMEDIYKIITTKVPNLEERQRTVFIGGHSLGTPLTALFAGWDFDGNPNTLEDAGYRNCAGLVLLDGPVFYWDINRFNNISHEDYNQQLQDIRAGIAPRFDFFQGVSPEAMALLEIMAMSAAAKPEEESTLFKNVPYSQEVAALLQLLHSRDLIHFISGKPAVSDFRYTNEALLGVFMDDNFQPVKMLQVSVGFLQGGPVVKKSFPGSLSKLLGIHGIDLDNLFIPWDAGPRDELGKGPLYSWVNFDEIGNANDPDYRSKDGKVIYTTMTEEMTDIQDFARVLYRGPSNYTEWYFPSRLRLDIGAAGAPFNKDVGLTFFHNARVDVPVIAFGAPHGDVPDISGWDEYKSSIASTEFVTIMAPGYNHLDIACAAVDRPGHRENLVFKPLLDFLFRSSEGKTLVP
ncbi:MAG: hypothetical protein FJZ83_02300 [Chloroflexi bacterium]|nr:hypothetical protein [Chloroflexota bacterium]